MEYKPKYNYYIIYTILTTAGFFLFTGSTTVTHPFIKGMTVSCQTWGYEWATPEMKVTMIELKNLGVNSISIHPYARIHEDGQIRFRKDPQSDHIITPVNWGKEMDIQLMIKPHLAYWGTKFKWRGEIDFNTEEEWQTFFRDYEIWIVYLATIAEECGARIFCIGTELMHSLKYEKEWRTIIAQIKKVYKGNLIYAANWDMYDKVPFWDELDYVGIQAYFPLAESEIPTDEQIISGWEGVYERIIPFATGLNKKIVFTEIGYDISEKAAQEPWRPGNSNHQQGEYIQKLCIEIALQKAQEYDQMAGLYLWKWFADTRPFEHHEDYNLQRPEIKSLLKEIWKE